MEFQIHPMLRWILKCALRVRLRDTDRGHDPVSFNDLEVHPTWWNQLISVYYNAYIEGHNPVEFREAAIPSGRRHRDHRPLFSLPMGSIVSSPQFQLEHVDASAVATSLPDTNDRHFIESSSPNIDVRASNNAIRPRSQPNVSRRRRQNRSNVLSGELVTNSSTDMQGFRPLIGVREGQPTAYVMDARSNESSTALLNLEDSEEEEEDKL